VTDRRKKRESKRGRGSEIDFLYINHLVVAQHTPARVIGRKRGTRGREGGGGKGGSPMNDKFRCVASLYRVVATKPPEEGRGKSTEGKKKKKKK